MNYFINGMPADKADLQRLKETLDKGVDFTLIKEGDDYYFILKI